MYKRQVFRRLVEEQILHDHAFHRAERGGHVLRVRIALRDILAFDVEAHEAAVERGFEHVRYAQARLVVQRHAPGGLEALPHGGIGYVPIAREFVRERTHVAGALHVVLAAQRIHADAGATEIAGRHGLSLIHI